MASKHSDSVEETPVSSSSVQELAKTDSQQLEESELERLAVEAILKETKVSKSRAERSGVLGWQHCPVPKANKRFLNNMVLSDVTSNKRRKTTVHRGSSPKRDLPQSTKKTLQSRRDLPVSKRDPPQSRRYLPVSKQDPPQSRRDLPVSKRDPPKSKRHYKSTQHTSKHEPTQTK